MRQRRLKAPASFSVAHYHCMSRVVNRDFVFGPQEREQFVRLLREYERFCGVRVLTFCILSNHFHLLVEVPARPALPRTDTIQSRFSNRQSHISVMRAHTRETIQPAPALESGGEDANRNPLSLRPVRTVLRRSRSSGSRRSGVRPVQTPPAHPHRCGRRTRRDRTPIGRSGDGGMPRRAAMLPPCASAV